MNWEVILTAVGLLTTLVLFVPIFVVYLLAYQKAKISAQVEASKEYHEMMHRCGSDINWNEFFEGETQ